MIKIICKDDEFNLKTKKGSCNLELVIKGDPHVISSQLASALKEIYDANAAIIINSMDILTHLIDKDIEAVEQEIDDYE